MIEDGRRGRVKHPFVLMVAVLLVLAGAVAVGFGLHAQRHAPQPSAAAAVPTASPAGPGVTSKAPKGPILAAATPTTLSIPSIGVDTSGLLRLGLNADRSVQVPPLARKSQAGWLDVSPAPGQLGPAVLLGHVDSKEYGPGIFFKLGALRRGAMVSVGRSDHSVAVFRVDRVVSYPKNQFPTLDVYGNTDSAALRLITCGGKFDLSRHSYESNIVAYASLVSSHQA